MPYHIVTAAQPIQIRRDRGSTVTFINRNADGPNFTGAWKPATAYTINQTIVGQLGEVWKVTTAGTSGATYPFSITAPVATANTTQADNTVTWTLQNGVGANASPAASDIYLSSEREQLSSTAPNFVPNGTRLGAGGNSYQWPNFPGAVWARGIYDTTGLEVIP
jgi:hypothetical protein